MELPEEATEEMIDAVHNEIGNPLDAVVLTRAGAANVWREMVNAYKRTRATGVAA